MRFLALAIIFLFFLPSLMAQHYDNQWIFGYSKGQEQLFGLNILDFNGPAVSYWYFRGSLETIGIGASFVGTEFGSLQYYSNNCTINRANGVTISGDSVITTAGLGESGQPVENCWALEGFYGYGAAQSVMLLPDLLNPDRFYAIHKDFTIDYQKDIGYSQHTWFSSITQSQNDEVFDKKYTINQEWLIGGKLAAVPNATLTGWWVPSARFDQQIFEVHFIGQDTAFFTGLYDTGIDMNHVGEGIGWAQFSPDSKTLAIATYENSVLLYDFDNETGEISNFREVIFWEQSLLAKGVAFSPNSRFLYLTGADQFTHGLYQIDLLNNNEVIHIADHWTVDDIGWPVGLGNMYLGPDCRIYVSPGSGTNELHVINQPNRKGKNCQFLPKHMKLPARVSTHFPVMPQYRYINGCDSSKQLIVEQINIQAVGGWLSIFPNPASYQIQVMGLQSDHIQVTNSVGQIVLEVQARETEVVIDITQLRNGIYYLSDGKSIGKFIKIE